MVSIVIVSLAGFGIQDVILGSMGQNIASIGKEKITVDEFLKSVENEILDFSQRNNVTLSVEDAKKYGLVNKALNDLIAKKIFDNLIKNEGISREIVNRIQNIRKDSGFNVSDKIFIEIENNNLIEKAIFENIDYIKNETLAIELKLEKKLLNSQEIEFDNIKVKIKIFKEK